jgi:hypothetical protein
LIEEKLSRLTSEQRREVEDFIDFLMTRDGVSKHADSGGGTRSFSEIADIPASGNDTLFGGSHEIQGSSGDDILADYPEYGDIGIHQSSNVQIPQRPQDRDIRRVRGRPDSKDPSRLLDWLD